MLFIVSYLVFASCCAPCTYIADTFFIFRRPYCNTPREPGNRLVSTLYIIKCRYLSQNLALDPLFVTGFTDAVKKKE